MWSTSDAEKILRKLTNFLFGFGQKMKKNGGHWNELRKKRFRNKWETIFFSLEMNTTPKCKAIFVLKANNKRQPNRTAYVCVLASALEATTRKRKAVLCIFFANENTIAQLDLFFLLFSFVFDLFLLKFFFL